MWAPSRPARGFGRQLRADFVPRWALVGAEHDAAIESLRLQHEGTELDAEAEHEWTYVPVRRFGPTGDQAANDLADSPPVPD